jgi:hypothetical protein
MAPLAVDRYLGSDNDTALLADPHAVLLYKSHL